MTRELVDVEVAIEAVEKDRMLSRHTAVHLLRLVQELPWLEVTSDFRHPSANRRAGGAENSTHLVGGAVDLRGRTKKVRQQIMSSALADRCDLYCTGPSEALDEGDHVHLAWRIRA